MSSSSQERRVVCYPHPKYFNLFSAYVNVQGITESQAGSEAIKKMIDALPPEVKRRVEEKARNNSKNSY